MGRKGKWFSAVKKAFRSPSKESNPALAESSLSQTKEDTVKSGNTVKKSAKEKRRWSFGKPTKPDSTVELREDFVAVLSLQEKSPLKKISEDNGGYDKEPSEPTMSIVATEAVVVIAPQAEVVHANGAQHASPYMHSTSREEWAVVKIQAGLRGFLARRVKKGMVRLQVLIKGHAVQTQSMTTLKCMQALVGVQSHIRARRARMFEEGLLLEQKLWQKRQQGFLARRSLGDGMTEEGWDDSVQTPEEIEMKKLSKQEAALKRERALAYAYSHQLWRSAPANVAALFMDFEFDKPHWGWSWIERSIAMGSMETQVYEKEKDITIHSEGVGGVSLLPSPQSSNNVINTTTTGWKTPSYESVTISKVPAKRAEERHRSILAPPSVMNSSTGFGRRSSSIGGGSSIRGGVDEESLCSYSSALPNYMIATESARAKLRSASTPRQRLDQQPSLDGGQNPVIAYVVAKKRLSFPGSDLHQSGTPRSTFSSSTYSQMSPIAKGLLMNGSDRKIGY